MPPRQLLPLLEPDLDTICLKCLHKSPRRRYPSAQALDEGTARYPVFRELRFAARIELEVLLDAVALDPAWRAERPGSGALVLDGDGLFVAAYGTRKADYCSCAFYLWAADIPRAEGAKQRILAKAGSTRITEPMFSIDWTFLSSRGELESASIEEMANDVLCDAAYPEIKGGVRTFIRAYLDAPETVLVLQGPPGTGKTRLIRAILGEMSRRKEEQARALYTGEGRGRQTALYPDRPARIRSRSATWSSWAVQAPNESDRNRTRSICAFCSRISAQT